MTVESRSAMIFGAGFGTRMGALTKYTPKPLLKVGGSTLLDRAIECASDANASPIVVNAHYLAEQVEESLAGRDIRVVTEKPDILDTGGGLKNALPVIGNQPLFTLNPDGVWAGPNPLNVLNNAWLPESMGALLLVVPLEKTVAHTGQGDFDINDDGRLSRGKSYVYTGAQIVDPSGLNDFWETSFSLNRYWDRLAENDRVFGLEYPGHWCDVGHPNGIAAAEDLLASAANV